MATIDLGRIKFKWQGAWSSSTAYVVDDVVESGGNTYVCILASTNNVPPNATYWELMAQKGTDTSVLTTQGDILYHDGTSLARLGAGTSGQALITNGTGANPSWGTISSGTYSVHKVDSYNYLTSVSGTGSSNYIDISGGNTVSFQPTSTSDKIYFSHTVPVNLTSGTGCGTYLMMGTSSTIGSSDTKLDYNGNHSTYENTNINLHAVLHQSFVMPCTGLSTSTTYYVEVAGACYDGATVHFGKQSSGHSGSFKGTSVSMIHYKFNS